MSKPLATYLQDHLAGSRFALTLLSDLQKQNVSPAASQLARQLHEEIEPERGELEGAIAKLNADPTSLKEISAWMAEKTGRLKFSLKDSFGVFEAVEFLSLAVLGKRALWRLLQKLDMTRRTGLNFETLIERAEKQHDSLEELRLILGPPAMSEK